MRIRIEWLVRQKQTNNPTNKQTNTPTNKQTKTKQNKRQNHRKCELPRFIENKLCGVRPGDHLRHLTYFLVRMLITKKEKEKKKKRKTSKKGKILALWRRRSL